MRSLTRTRRGSARSLTPGVETDSIRIVDMPDLGAVTEASSVVGEHLGSGRFSASSLRKYIRQNARDFGARGDGVTDDTAALRAAFGCGTPVYLSAGKYRVTGPVTVVANQIVVADNVNAYDDPTTMPASVPITEIVADNAGGGFVSGDAVLTLNDRASIAGFAITSVANVDAVYAPGRFVRMERIYTRYGRHGANLNAVGPQVFACRFQSASGHGIWGQSSCTDCLCVGVFVVGNGLSGAYFQDGIKHQLVGCTAEWNSSHGYEFYQGASCALTSCASDRNNGAGLRLASSTNMSVVGSIFHRNGASGIAPAAHVSLGGVLSSLSFSGNTYRAFNSMDDLSGTPIPAYSFYVEPGMTLTNSVFADPMVPGTAAFFNSTISDALVRPFFLVSAGDTPGRYANDAGAAANGVEVGCVYIDTAGIFRQRVA